MQYLAEQMIKKRPATLAYNSSGTGATQQLAVEYLAKQTNIKFKHVPYKGGAPACTTLFFLPLRPELSSRQIFLKRINFTPIC